MNCLFMDIAMHLLLAPSVRFLVTTTHFYAVAPGRCRYLGSRNMPDPSSLPGATLAPGEQLLTLPHQNQETAREQALHQAQALITPDLLTWHGGAYLRALREAAGLSLDGLQQASHVALQAIWRLEHGDVTNPQYATLAMLGYVLTAPLCALFTPLPPPWDLPGKIRPLEEPVLPELDAWAGGPSIGTRREAANLSQVELGLATGLTAKQISLIETGKSTNPKYATLCRLALGLDTTVCDLIAGSPAGYTPVVER
jgi:transcriptional regulator with XRE-family HTH domain